MAAHTRHGHSPAGHAQGPTGPGSVVLELGGHIGALVLEVPPELSGQEIEITTAASLGPKARFTLRSPNLNKSARRLHKQGIKPLKSNDTLTIADPDGNHWTFATFAG